MRLYELLSELNSSALPLSLPDDLDIIGLAEDSRLVQAGYLFIAIPGKETDGHNYIPQAIDKGAVAIIGQNPQNSILCGVPYIQVDNIRNELSVLASKFYGFPTKQLKVIGITGTDGKTTTTSFIHAILASAGHKTSMVTTLGAVVDGKMTETGTHVTTPGSIQIQAFLSEMVSRGDEYAVLETTSHALAQARVRHCNFDVAVITNITHEHLNYHGTFEAYRDAKAILFHSLLTESCSKPNTPKTSVLNRDDSSYEFLLPISAEVKFSYSLKDFHADFYASNIIHTSQITAFTAHTPSGICEVEMSLIGDHNVSNALAAIAACYSQNIPLNTIVRGIKSLMAVKARMQRVDEGQDFDVFVDYAHTPNALKQVLKLARQLTQKRVILVFGLSGGLRDTIKRPIMGEIAGTMADKVVITAVDWYNQDVGEILEEIANGCEIAHRVRNKDYWCVREREAGIQLGTNIAESGDVVIIAGKGHETSISSSGIEHEWNEFLVVKRSLRAKLDNCI